MTSTAARRLAWGLWILAVALAIPGEVLSGLNHTDLLENTLFGPIFMSMGFVGALIASRRPDNAIGWVLVGSTVAIALAFVSGEAATYSFETNPGSIPGAVWLAWYSSWGWAAAIGPILTFLFLLFPDGHLPSPRWRAVGWAAGLLIALVVVLGAVNPQAEMPVNVENPIGLDAAAA